MPIRVVLLEDDRIFRQRLRERLAFTPEVSVVADAGDPAGFFAVIALLSDPPDVALVDIGLREHSGIDVAERLSVQHPGVGVLMLTVFEDDDHVLRAIQAGASGYLLKDTPVEQLVEAIREVQAGGVPLSRPIARRILGLAGQWGRARRPPQGDEAELSARERELLELIVQGDTESAISTRLSISPHTVRTHVKNIYRKLRVGTRGAAVRRAFERGLVEP